MTSSPTFFTQAEVSDFQVAILVEKQVVEFEIAINNLVVMEILKSQDDASAVETAGPD